MECAAIEIDILAVGRAMDAIDLGAQPLKQCRTQVRGRPVSPVYHDFHAGKSSGKGSGQVLYVSSVEPFIDCQPLGRGRFSQSCPREYVALESMLLLIRQLEAGMIEDLDTVVLVRIMRGRDHHAGGERARARDISQAGRSSQTRVAHADAALG